MACNKSNPKNQSGSLLDIGFKKDTVSLPKNDPSDLFSSTANHHYGIDISHFQGDVMKVYQKSDSLRFVICKATQGADYVDPDFKNNWNEIKAQGLIRGTYHFYMCSDDPVKQAENFANTVQDISSLDIAPILDIEQGSMTSTVSGSQMEKDILVFLKSVENRLNRKPMIYTDYDFAQQYLKNPEFADYNLWLAEYSGAVQPLVPDIWKEKGIKIWQKSDTYYAYSRALDLDEYSGDLRNIVK
ncbi:MAG: GH25 family lysozyme [Bacteroidota bacterium]